MQNWKQQLTQWKQLYMTDQKIKKKKKRKIKEEKINWNEIMGVNRPRYKRGKGGAFRQR